MGGDRLYGLFIGLFDLDGFSFETGVILFGGFHNLIKYFIWTAPLNSVAFALQEVSLDVEDAQIFDGFLVVSFVSAVEARVISATVLELLPQPDSDQLAHFEIGSQQLFFGEMLLRLHKL